MSDAERKAEEAKEYNSYRLSLLAQAILQVNEAANYTLLDPALETRLRENFQYTFGEDYTEKEEEE